MSNGDYYDRTNAPIQCPLKKSVIAWARCPQYRRQYGCLCKEARDRLRWKAEGKEVFEQKLHEIRQPFQDSPPGWSVERMTRFYVILDDHGERVHRTTNQEECEHYLRLAARAKALEEENRKLWALLEEELIGQDDPWAEVDERLATAEAVHDEDDDFY